MSTAGLLAVTAPTSALVSHPREWESDGDEGREVMSPAEESPRAKLHQSPRRSQKLPDYS